MIQHKSLIVTMTLRDRQPTDLGYVYFTVEVPSQLSDKLLHQCLHAFTDSYKIPPGLVMIYCPTVPPTDTLTATEKAPKAIRLELLIEPAAMAAKEFGILRQNQFRYKTYFDEHIQTMPKPSFG